MGHPHRPLKYFPTFRNPAVELEYQAQLGPNQVGGCRGPGTVLKVSLSKSSPFRYSQVCSRVKSAAMLLACAAPQVHSARKGRCGEGAGGFRPCWLGHFLLFSGYLQIRGDLRTALIGVAMQSGTPWAGSSGAGSSGYF